MCIRDRCYGKKKILKYTIQFGKGIAQNLKKTGFEISVVKIKTNGFCFSLVVRVIRQDEGYIELIKSMKVQELKDFFEIERIESFWEEGRTCC